MQIHPSSSPYSLIQDYNSPQKPPSYLASKNFQGLTIKSPIIVDKSIRNAISVTNKENISFKKSAFGPKHETIPLSTPQNQTQNRIYFNPNINYSQDLISPTDNSRKISINNEKSFMNINDVSRLQENSNPVLMMGNFSKNRPPKIDYYSKDNIKETLENQNKIKTANKLQLLCDNMGQINIYSESKNDISCFIDKQHENNMELNNIENVIMGTNLSRENKEVLKTFMNEMPGENISLKMLVNRINKKKIDEISDLYQKRKKNKDELLPCLIEECLILKQFLIEKTKESDLWKRKFCDERVEMKILTKKNESTINKFEQILKENEKLNLHMNKQLSENEILVGRLSSINQRDTIYTLNSEFGSLGNNTQELQNRLKAISNENEKLFKENEGLLRELSDTKRITEENDGIFKIIKKDIDDKENENKKLKSIINEQDNFIEKINKKNNDSEEKEKLIEEIHNLKNELEMKKKELEKNNGLDVESLLKENVKYIKENTKLNKELNRLQSEAHESFHKPIDLPNETYNKLIENSKILQEKINFQSEELLKFKKSLDEISKKYEKDILIYQEFIKILQTNSVDSNIDLYKKKTKDLESELLQCHVCISDLEKKIKTLISEKERIRESSVLFSNESSMMMFEKRPKTELKKSNLNLNSNCDISKLKDINNRYTEEINTLNNQISYWKQISSKHSNEIDNLMILLDNKKKEINLINKNYEMAKKENRLLTKKLMNAEEEIENLNSEKHEFKEIIENQSFLMRDKEIELEEKLNEVDGIRNKYQEAMLDVSQQFIQQNQI